MIASLAGSPRDITGLAALENKDSVVVDTNVLGRVFSKKPPATMKALLDGLRDQKILRTYKKGEIGFTPLGVFEVLGALLEPIPDSFKKFAVEQLKLSRKMPLDDQTNWNLIQDEAHVVSRLMLSKFPIENLKAMADKRISELPEVQAAEFKFWVRDLLENKDFPSHLEYCVKSNLLLGLDIPKNEEDLREIYESRAMSHVAHHGFGQPVFRVAKSIYETLKPDVFKDSSAEEKIEKLRTFDKRMRFKSHRDLLDSDLLHAACMGKLYESEWRQTKILTCDDPTAFKSKLAFYMLVLRSFYEKHKKNPNFAAVKFPVPLKGRVIFLCPDLKVVEDFRVPSFLDTKELRRRKMLAL